MNASENLMGFMEFTSMQMRFTLVFFFFNVGGDTARFLAVTASHANRIESKYNLLVFRFFFFVVDTRLVRCLHYNHVVMAG